MGQQKPQTVRTSTAAAAFAADHTIVTDRETGEPMTWDGSSEWHRGEDALLSIFAEWTGQKVRDEINSCPITWCRGAGTFARLEALNRKIRFDARPHVIAFRNYQAGIDVMDLRDGKRRRARPDDRVEMLLGESPDESFKTPNWNTFLDHVTCGRHDLRRYLLRLAGYTICGNPREEAVILLKGAGGNGKGVFLRVLRELLGQHSVEVAADFFLPSAAYRHTTELADLHNRRLIVQPEAAEGRWAVQRIKMLAGGDGTIRARRMREDQSDIKLMGVPWFGVNSTPTLQGGTAMARRLRVIPFDHVPAIPDVTLKERLRLEYRGILHALLQEAVTYLREGLGAVPDCVTDESSVFLHDSAPPLDAWLDECAEIDAEAETPFAHLLSNMRAWFEDGGHKTIPSSTTFGRFLTDRGCGSVQRGKGRTRCRQCIRIAGNDELF